MRTIEKAVIPLPIVLVLLSGLLFAQDDHDARDPVRRVYVPVEDLDAVLNRDRKGVLLPAEEFEELEAAARANAGGTSRTPEGLVLSAADYTATISGEQLLVTVSARFTNFADGWAQLAIPASGLGVEQVTLDDEPARVARSPENGENLLLFTSEPGPHTLVIEASAKLTALGSDKVAGFETFATPTGQFRMTVPAGSFLSLGGVEIERPSPAEEEAVYEVPIGGRFKGARRIDLRISDRQATAAGDAFVLADTAFGVHVAPGEVTWRAVNSVHVFGRTIDRLVCSIPTTLEITDVQSTGLESWDLADSQDGERTVITLTYRQPFSDDRKITFTGVVSTSPGEPWTVPDLTVQSVSSHVGRVVVHYSPGVRVQLTDSRGVRPVLPETAMDPNNPSLEYEVWEEDFLLSFVTASKEREVHAAMTTLLDVNAEGLDLYVTLDARTLFAPLFDVRLRVPAEWNVTSATVAGQPADWKIVPAEAGVHDIRIALSPPLGINETRQIALAAHRDLDDWPIEDAAVRFSLPEVRLPQVDVVEALYGVTADDDLEIAPVDLSGLDPAGSEDVALLDSKLAPLGKSVRLGFTYQDTVFTGQLEASRKPSRVSAATVTFFRIDPETLFSHLEAHLSVEGGGVRELQVAVSESAGTDLRFRLIRPFVVLDGAVQQSIAPPVDSVRIVEQRPEEPADGMRNWTLALDRRARGDLVLLVDVQTPRDESESYAPFLLNVLGADRQSGHIAVEAGPEQHVAVTAADADGASLSTVDPVDFPPSYYIPAQRVVAGFQYVLDGWQMSVAPTRYDREAVPTAVVHRAAMRSVLGETGDFQHQADLTLTAVGVQNLKLQLPTGVDGAPAELWAALVDGSPVEVRRGEDGVLITLSTVDNPEQQRSLTLSYRTRVEPLDQWSGRLRQSPPRLSAVSGSGEEQPLEILEQVWTIYHSGKTLIVESDGRFHPEEGLDRSGLLGRIESGFAAPSPRTIWSGIVAVSITIVVLWVLSLGFRHTRLLGVVVGCLIIGAVFFVLLLPATQQSREAARRGYDNAVALEAPAGSSATSDDFSAAADGAFLAAPEAVDRELASDLAGADGMEFGAAAGGDDDLPAPPAADAFADEAISEAAAGESRRAAENAEGRLEERRERLDAVQNFSATLAPDTAAAAPIEAVPESEPARQPALTASGAVPAQGGRESGGSAGQQPIAGGMPAGADAADDLRSSGHDAVFDDCRRERRRRVLHPRFRSSCGRGAAFALDRDPPAGRSGAAAFSGISATARVSRRRSISRTPTGRPDGCSRWSLRRSC